MNNISIGSIMIALCILLSACQGSEFNIEFLKGEWKVSKWEVERTREVRKNKMDMTFESNGTYTINYGTQLEKGKYWLANEFLHTVETNESEKKVKILKLSNDTFHMQMNRGGELENVLLIKQ